ncbi:unnamed protein product [Effrenium voratum]|nr:unnamed protein product [Effrenium voratum]
MGKKPILVTLEEFSELKAQLQAQIGRLQKDFQAKVPACEDNISQLQVAKGELAKDLEVAKAATQRVAEDAQAFAGASCRALEQRLGAQMGELKNELRRSDEELQKELRQLEEASRKTLSDELHVLCERLDQDFADVRSEMSESVQKCKEHFRVELQKLCELLAASIEDNKQEALRKTAEFLQAAKSRTETSLQEEQQARAAQDQRFASSEAEIWLKLERLGELIDETGQQAEEHLAASNGHLDQKFSQAFTLADQRLLALDDTSTRLRAGLCEVQNSYTRKVTWVIREASKKIKRPLLDDVKIQPHVSWFSPQFDAGGCHGLQLELQVFRIQDPPVDGQEVGDCMVYLWATKGSNLVFKLGLGGKCQLLEKRFNGRVPYGTTRLCFFADQINKEDDTLHVSCEILEALRELEAPLQPAAPQPPDWRKALEEQGKPVPEVDPAVAAAGDRSNGPQPLEGQLFYSMHINNRLYDQVKDQVESMRCRLVKTVEWRIEKASMLRRCFPPGEALSSTVFGAAGIEQLQLVFYPSGYTGATEGFCSLFLNAPAGVTMKCLLQAGKEKRDANHVFDRPGAFGRTNFCQLESCMDEDDTILIRLEVTEAHQDLVAKLALPPKPGDPRNLSQQEGVACGPVMSAVKLRRQGNVLEDVKVLPSLWTVKFADDPCQRPQGYHDFNEFRSEKTGTCLSASVPVGSATALARVRPGTGARDAMRPKTAGRQKLNESLPSFIDGQADASSLGDRAWLDATLSRPKSAGMLRRRPKAL